MWFPFMSNSYVVVYTSVQKTCVLYIDHTYLDATSVRVSDMISLFLRQLLPWKPPGPHNGIS